MINEYHVMDMEKLFDYKPMNANLIIADPPFGIKFDGKNKNNYNRTKDSIVEGYVEWNEVEYYDNILMVLYAIERHLDDYGSALVFSSWNNADNIIWAMEYEDVDLYLQGKLYYAYNFIPPCRKRPNHNIYEIFWFTKDRKKWTYNNRCSTSHCTEGEKNLALLQFKREYRKGLVRYPTMFPLDLVKCLIEHFSNEGDLIMDFMAGSGIVGIAAQMLKRDFILSDINPNGKKVYKTLKEYYFGD